MRVTLGSQGRNADMFDSLLALLRKALETPERQEPPPEKKIRDPEALRTAIHEAGHAVCAWHNPHVVSIGRIQIGSEGGIVQYIESNSGTQAELWWKIVVGLGGIAAELEEYDRFQSGPARLDLEGVRDLAIRLSSKGIPNPPWSDPVVLPPTYFDVSRTLKSIHSTHASAAVLNLSMVKARKLIAGDSRRKEIVRLLGHHDGHLDNTHVHQIFGHRIPFFR